jgi:hypothetical protein
MKFNILRVAGISLILLFIILPLDCIMDSKYKCKSGDKEGCKVMTLDEKIKILDCLYSGMNAEAVG